jgi:hypothetical protein
VIGRNRALAGNASLEFVRASGQVVGPALGGALVGVVSAAHVLLIQAVTFVVSALTLLGVRAREQKPAPSPTGPGLLGQIIEGLRFVAGNRLGELVGTRATLVVAGAILAVAPAVLCATLRHVRDIDDVTPS